MTYKTLTVKGNCPDHGGSQRQLAAFYGVDKGTIAGIKNGKTWRSVV